ncbi:hypothetical protein HQ533_00405 [Candidatus Woesearchaeota archaeon]|nr:hypothetical protein [Candidatus Woesearchaeota archaeon]
MALSGTLLDTFGWPLENVGDIVHAELTDDFEGVKLIKIKDDPGLPLGEENVVEAVGKKVYELAKAKNKGIKLILEKRMRIGCGMGSSASSGVASAVAVNEILGKPFKKDSNELLQASVYGEYVACGAAHSGNAVPALLGGPVFIYNAKTLEHTKFKTPSFYMVLVNPELIVRTRDARKVLWESPYDIPKLIKKTHQLVKKNLDQKPPFKISKSECMPLVQKGGSIEIVRKYLLAGLRVMFGFKKGDLDMIGESLEEDHIVTAVRSILIKGYSNVKYAAKKAGAKAFCISGSGPSVFALAETKKEAEKIGNAMIKAFRSNKIKAVKYVSKINKEGAKVVDKE